MIILLTIVHVIVSFFLILVVLLQSGKAADIAGAFGGMGSQTTFGPRGSATALSKATATAAGLFMVTSLSLAILHTRVAGSAGTGSALDGLKNGAPAATTAAPAAPPKQEIQIPVQIPAQGDQKAPAEKKSAPEKK